MVEGVVPPRLLAWEVTQACNLACRHCRAEARTAPAPDELSDEEGRDLLRQAAAWRPAPMIILTGGEPLMRPGILDLAAYGRDLGLRMLMSPNGVLVDEKTAGAMKSAGIARVSLSLDGADEKSHDDFRGWSGSWVSVRQAAGHLRRAGLPFQINSTLTPDNLDQAEALSQTARDWGAVGHHIFLLVPVGRGRDMKNSLPASAYEELLKSLKAREPFLEMDFKVTCAPQYQRLGRQMGLTGGGHGGRGCLGGQPGGFLFIGHSGQVQACGYLPLAAGHLRKQSLAEIHRRSPLFLSLRDKKNYRGKCGRCEYWAVCGGCRARALARDGDFLGPEPLCPHNPPALAPLASEVICDG